MIESDLLSFSTPTPEPSLSGFGLDPVKSLGICLISVTLEPNLLLRPAGTVLWAVTCLMDLSWEPERSWGLDSDLSIVGLSIIGLTTPETLPTVLISWWFKNLGGCGKFGMLEVLLTLRNISAWSGENCSRRMIFWDDWFGNIYGWGL